MNNTKEARKKLRSQGESTEQVDSVVQVIARCELDDLEELLCRVHDSAGRLPYVDDCDYGALALEALADTASGKLRVTLLQHALYRARWCAQACTGGGEGLSRARHIAELESKLHRNR